MLTRKIRADPKLNPVQSEIYHVMNDMPGWTLISTLGLNSAQVAIVHGLEKSGPSKKYEKINLYFFG